jgi:hypothetical protein
MKSCGCPAVIEEKSENIKSNCCPSVNFFWEIPRSMRYNSNGSHKMVCQTVLNSIQETAKLERLNVMAVITAADFDRPISRLKRYINIMPNATCSMTRMVHATCCGRRK